MQVLLSDQNQEAFFPAGCRLQASTPRKEILKLLLVEKKKKI